MLSRIDVRQVITGQMSAAWVWEFVERLKLEPWSHFRAHLLEKTRDEPAPEQQGEDWRAWVGWGPTQDKLTEGFDLLAVKGVGAQSARKFKGSYRPGRAPRLIAKTVAELRNSSFVQRFNPRGESHGASGGRQGRGPG